MTCEDQRAAQEDCSLCVMGVCKSIPHREGNNSVYSFTALPTALKLPGNFRWEEQERIAEVKMLGRRVDSMKVFS